MFGQMGKAIGAGLSSVGNSINEDVRAQHNKFSGPPPQQGGQGIPTQNPFTQAAGGFANWLAQNRQKRNLNMATSQGIEQMRPALNPPVDTSAISAPPVPTPYI